MRKNLLSCWVGNAAFLTSLLSVSFLYAGEPGFTRAVPALTVSVGAIEPGANVGSIGWTGTDSAVTNVLGAVPSQPGYEGKVLQSIGVERNNITSPVLSPPTGFPEAEAVYFSGWILRTTDYNSGGRVLLRNAEGTVLGGFGITDVKSTPLISTGSPERGHFAIFTTGQNYYSDEPAITNHWYEMVLVIRQAPGEPEKNIGYLFVRNVTAGESDFRLIEDIAAAPLHHTGSLNLGHLTHFRIEGFRANGQIGDIAAGMATLNLQK